MHAFVFSYNSFEFQGVCASFQCPYDSRPGRNGCYGLLFSVREKVFKFTILAEFQHKPPMPSILNIDKDDAQGLMLALARHIGVSNVDNVIDYSAKLVLKIISGEVEHVGYLVVIHVVGLPHDDGAETGVRVPTSDFEYRHGSEKLIMSTSLYDGPMTRDPEFPEYYFNDLTAEQQSLRHRTVFPAPIVYCPYVVLTDICSLLGYQHITPYDRSRLSRLPRSFVRVKSLSGEKYYTCVDDCLDFVLQGQQTGSASISFAYPMLFTYTISGVVSLLTISLN